MSIAARDSIASDTSITTYASTFSTLKASALGLTESPHDPTIKMSSPCPTVQQSIPSQHSPNRLAEQRQKSMPQVRPQTSNSSLDSSVQVTRSRPRPQRPVSKRPSNLANSITNRPITPEQSRAKDTTLLIPSRAPHSQSTSPRPPSAASRPASTPQPLATTPRRDVQATRQSTAESTTYLVARPKQPVARKAVPVDGLRVSPRIAMARSITQPEANLKYTRPPTEAQTRSAPRDKVPSSPTKSVDTMAEDWEAELTRDAMRLHIDNGGVDRGKGRMAREEQRAVDKAVDKDWERSGMWDTQRGSAREAEDRTRRDAGREIAYPPVQPRNPIRADPSGVTSVHVGIRPRLHPSRESDSYISNQPNEALPQPLFSPLQSQSINLPNEQGVRSSYNTVYVHEMAEKAKGEYEAWKARKAEREAGVGEDGDGYGTRDWMPKSRIVAKPGAVEGIAHSEGFNDHRLKPDDYVRPGSSETAVKTPQEANVWAQYGYPQYQRPMSFQGGDNWGYMDPNQIQQGFWDPSMWWSMQGMQEEGDQLVQSTEDQFRKVHFAKSPEKLKHKVSLQDIPQEEQYGMDQLQDRKWIIYSFGFAVLWLLSPFPSVL